MEPSKKAGIKVFVFGSRARGDFKKFSDLDLLLESSKQISLGFVANLSENLSHSNLPIKVDLVRLEDLAKAYKENVMRERIEL